MNTATDHPIVLVLQIDPAAHSRLSADRDALTFKAKPVGISHIVSVVTDAVARVFDVHKTTRDGYQLTLEGQKVFGQPVNRDVLKDAKVVAGPGCFTPGRPARMGDVALINDLQTEKPADPPKAKPKATPRPFARVDAGGQTRMASDPDEEDKENTTVTTTTDATPADPHTAQAEREWGENKFSCREIFSTKERFVALRRAELSGLFTDHTAGRTNHRQRVNGGAS